MTTYGVVPEGFNIKTLPVILAEVEADNITELGPQVIQTPQEPLGQINGLFSRHVAFLWEMALDIYQAHDVDQAESRRLEVLGKLRLLSRGTNENDVAYRRAITNQGRARIDLQDLARAIRGIPDVTYAQVFLNESNIIDENQLEPGTICIAAIGGDEAEIALQMRRFIVPGISTFGNIYVSTNVEGFCRSIAILRPILSPVELIIKVRTRNDIFGCPAPSVTVIRDYFIEQATALFVNGQDVTHFNIRSIIESRFPNVEVRSFTGEKDGINYTNSSDIPVAFVELATFTADDIVVDPT